MIFFPTFFMRAIFHQRFGDVSVLQSGEIAEPRLRDDELRVQVCAVALNPLDVELREGKMRWLYGRRFPMIPAHDFAGEVLETGKKVMDFVPGDAVYGMRRNGRGGAWADQLVVHATEAALKPPGIDYVQAAAIPLAAQTALQGLRDEGRLQAGQRLLINGASGGVGVFAVQIAKILGAHVTAVCSHRNAERVSKLGADEVVDYTQTRPETLSARFDLIFDVYGNKRFSKIRHLLQPQGRHVSTIPSPANFFAQYRSLLNRQRARVVVVRSRRTDLDQLSAWVAAGELQPVVDRVYAWNKAAEAYSYLETRRASGKVVARRAEG
jgi:NADPH:quinone reductase-like Zn-dependent oxidoreductase